MGARRLRSRWRHLAPVGFVCISVVVQSGCSGTSEPPLRHLVSAGSELGDEFVVPAGSRLMGARFPGRKPESWSALLLVDGDPVEVMEDLVAQSVDADLATTTTNNVGRACRVHVDSLLECSLYATGAAPPRTYGFELRWGLEAGATYSHVFVRRDPHEFPLPEFVDLGAGRPGVDLPAGPRAVDSWEPPEAGQPVAVIPDWFAEAPVELEAGSIVIGPPGHSTCGTGGYTAVLRLDNEADLDDVMARYGQQLEDFGVGGTTTGTFEGEPFVAARYGSAGGGELEVTAIGEGPTLLMVFRCND